MRVCTRIISGSALLVVVATCVYFVGFGLPGGTPAAQATTRTVQATTKSLEKTVSATGTLNPTIDKKVNFAASGTVTSVAVVKGDTVKKGDTLATIDSVTVKANLLSAKATLESANASLSNDESAADGSTSSGAQIAADKAAVAQATASLKSARQAAASTTLKAPVSGLVTSVNLDVGDTVTSSASSDSSGTNAAGSSSSGVGTSGNSSASTSSSSSGSQFEIVGTSSWKIKASVSATDVKKISKGDQAELSTDDNSSFFGTVKSIGRISDSSSGSATFPVVVTVTGSPKNLYDGVSVTADIVYKRTQNAIVVPSLAVTTHGGTSTVQKVTNGNATTTHVTVGQTSGMYTQITNGLSSGDSVMIKTFTPGAATNSSSGRQSGNGGAPGQAPSGGRIPGGEMPGGGQTPGGNSGSAGGNRG